MFTNKNNDLEIIYDGECPFCTNFVAFVRLKEAAQVTLINARDSHHPAVKEVKNLGMDLNEGMAVKYQGQWHYGAESMQLLARLSEEKRITSKLFKKAFLNNSIYRSLYATLKLGRKITLKTLGRSRID